MPLGEKNLCICVQMKWKIEGNLESQGLSSVTGQKWRVKALNIIDYKAANVNHGILI